VREVEIDQEREAYRQRTYHGGTIKDLETLAVTHPHHFGVLHPDFPWPFDTYSGKGKQRSAERRYDTMTLAEIKALAAPNCMFLPWGSWPLMPQVLEVIEACGFAYKGLGFEWIKTTKRAAHIELDGNGPRGHWWPRSWVGWKWSG
jgi:hypothetical protein